MVDAPKEEMNDEQQQFTPGTSGSGMQIITHIPRFIFHAHPGIRMMAMKFQAVSFARI